MTRILHVLDHSLPLHSGYTFRTRAIMKAQIAAGWDVAALSGVRQYQGGQVRGPEEEMVDGLRFFRTTGRAHGPTPLQEWREVALLAGRIAELHRQWPFDIVHAHSPVLGGLAALRASQRLGVPFLYEIRAFWEDAAVGNGTGTEGSAKYWLTRRLETHVVRQADAVAVICEGLRGDLITRGINPGKIMVSPNGVDMEMFGDPPAPDEALRRKIGLSGDAVLGFIGSYYDYEGLDDLIDAMALLHARGQRAQLLLVGGGPMEEALRARAAVSPAADSIHFIGRVPHEEVELYYSLIDILVYPRKRMRLTDLVTPLKPLEAMAQGRLVAASDVGGHRELIRDGETGTLFAADNPEALANAVTAMLKQPENWAKRRDVARRYVKDERNWERNILRYEPVYHYLLRRDMKDRAA